MRMSRFFSQTLRRSPSEADVTSHQLLLRAGYIRQLGAGLFSYMPLGKRSTDQDRGHHPRGDGCHRRAGDGDAGGQPGRGLEKDQPLVRDRR